jgi:hypothetical protein
VTNIQASSLLVEAQEEVVVAVVDARTPGVASCSTSVAERRTFRGHWRLLRSFNVLSTIHKPGLWRKASRNLAVNEHRAADIEGQVGCLRVE